MRKLYPEAVVAWAESQIGYKEKKSNAYLDEWTYNAGSGNYNKYARDMNNLHFYNYGNSDKQGKEWCTQFVAWCLWKAADCTAQELRHIMCVPDGEENLAAGATQLYNYFKKKGRIFSTPQLGDVLFVDNDGVPDPDHVGWVTDLGAEKFYGTEGNKDNGVTPTVYPYGYSKILGFGRPMYDTHEDAELLNKYNNMKKKYNILAEKITNIQSIVND